MTAVGAGTPCPQGDSGKSCVIGHLFKKGSPAEHGRCAPAFNAGGRGVESHSRLLPTAERAGPPCPQGESGGAAASRRRGWVVALERPLATYGHPTRSAQ